MIKCLKFEKSQPLITFEGDVKVKWIKSLNTDTRKLKFGFDGPKLVSFLQDRHQKSLRL